MFIMLCAAAALALYVQWDESQRTVLCPALVLCFVVATFAALLHAKEGHFPLADIGLICAAATLCYIAVPLVFFVLGGSEFTSLSDARLVSMRTTIAELSDFGWDGVFYLVPFCLGYLVTRGYSRSPLPLCRDRAQLTSVALILFGCLAFLWAIEHAYSVSFSLSNEQLAEHANSALPHSVAQITNVVINLVLLAKIYLVLLIVASARRHPSLWIVLLLWLSYEAYAVVSLGGERTPVAILFLSLVLGYHRHVKPIRAPIIAILGAVFITSILAYGYYRDVGHTLESPFSASTEFQAVMATVLHIKRMAVTGNLPSVPWQVRWSEFVNFIPQQIAPFQKIDPANWYLTLLGDNTSGYMFGVLSQAAIGWGRPELIVRGSCSASSWRSSTMHWRSLRPYWPRRSISG